MWHRTLSEEKYQKKEKVNKKIGKEEENMKAKMKEEENEVEKAMKGG